MPMTITKKGSGLQVVNQEKTRVLGRQFIFHPLRMREDFERKQFLAHQVQVLVDRGRAKHTKLVGEGGHAH